MIKQLKEDLLKYSHKLGFKNFSPGTSGNISVKFENIYLISGSGTCLSELKEDEIVMFDEEYNVLDGQIKPSSEKSLHVEIYKKRPDIEAIIHVHSPKLSAFAVANLPLNKNILSESVLQFGQIPIAKYAMPSSDELAEITSKYFDKHDVVLMANHGVIVGAKTLKDAYYKLESAESYAEIFLNSLILRKQVELNEQDVEDLINLKQGITNQ